MSISVPKLTRIRITSLFIAFYNGAEKMNVVNNLVRVAKLAIYCERRYLYCCTVVGVANYFKLAS